MSDHIVICGVGRTGKIFASSLMEKGVQVVGVDLGPPEDFDEWYYQKRVPIIFGNFNLRPLLEKAGAAKARSIIFASGDDLSNLEGAISAYEWLQTDSGPFRLIWAQITNERLPDSCRVAVHTHGRIGIRFFDIYCIAAIRITAKDYKQEGNKQDC